VNGHAPSARGRQRPCWASGIQQLSLRPSLASIGEPIGIGNEGWRFTLREDVTFHDGAAFDAEDVVFSFERASVDASDVKTFFATVERIEAPDDRTVEFIPPSRTRFSSPASPIG